MATSLLTENKLHLEDLGVLGHGTFGTVRKARYKNELVAVKIFDRRSPHVNETEFHKDLNQLKRFSHPNIIRIITHGKYNLHNSIVMEYADVGSLDTVLHEKHNLNYTINHAVSWLYQTANGVHYLHTHNTKPIAHRDLKPMNLLLMKGGTVLKLCDFGTACELHSLMTCERGTTLYMAPEVLSSKDLGSFRIMFMVKEKALRPTQISKCPSLLKTIYDRCVDAIPEKRPSMDHLLKIFGKLNELTNRNPVRPIVEPETPKVLRAADLKPFTTSNESLLSQVSTCSTVLGKTVKKIENTGSTDTDFVLINDVSDDDTELMRDIKFRLSFHNNANQKTNKLDQATIKGHRRSRSYGNAEVSINFNNNNTNNSNININNNNSSNQLNNNLCVNFVNDSKYAAGNNNNNNNNLPTGASKAPPNRFFSESNTPISPNNPINQLNLLNPSALNEFDFNSTQLIEPILDSPQSIKLYNEHCHCMQLSSKLDEEFTQLHKQKEQLEKQIRNQDVFFDLQKQKQVLETENSKLAAKLLNSNY